MLIRRHVKRSVFLLLAVIVSFFLPCFGWVIGGITASTKIPSSAHRRHFGIHTKKSRHPCNLPLRAPSVISNRRLHVIESQGNKGDVPVTSLTASTGSSKSVGLWLDLRETAIFPKAALAFLNEKLARDVDPLVDKVILSEDTMIDLIRRQSTATSSATQQPSDVTVLYVPDIACPEGDDNAHDLVLSCSQRNQSFPCGKVIQSKNDGVLFNPLVALDIVVSQRGWALLEPGRESNHAEFLDEVSSLMTFLSSSWTGTGSNTMNSNGLVLPTATTIPAEPLSSKSAVSKSPAGCGMAICCPTRSLLVDVSKYIMTQSSLPTGTSTSEGGILFPSATNIEMSTDEDGDALSSLMFQSSDERNHDSMPIAVAIPLDIQMWETAMDLFMSDNSHEYDYESDDVDR